MRESVCVCERERERERERRKNVSLCRKTANHPKGRRWMVMMAYMILAETRAREKETMLEGETENRSICAKKRISVKIWTVLFSGERWERTLVRHVRGRGKRSDRNFRATNTSRRRLSQEGTMMVCTGALRVRVRAYTDENTADFGSPLSTPRSPPLACSAPSHPRSRCVK